VRKLLKYWPHILNVALLITVIWMVADDKKDEPQPAPTPSHTGQDLDKAVQLKAGIKAEDVEKLMGSPIKKEFVGENEEWHYCRTGNSIDEYVAIRLSKGVVTELEHYSVSYLDTIFRNTLTPPKELVTVIGLGDCKNTVRWGTYGQKVPQMSAAGAAQPALPADEPRPAGSSRP
jgi:hypothetical protein